MHLSRLSSTSGCRAGCNERVALIGIAGETQELSLLCRHRTFEGVGTQIERVDVHGHEDVDEAGCLQSVKKGFGSKAGLVCIVILARGFYFLAVAIKNVSGRDRTQTRNVENILDIQLRLHDPAHDGLEVGDTDLRKAIGFQDMHETGQYLTSVVSIVMLEIV